MKVEDLFFALNRPEYVPNPEAVQSELAWQVYNLLSLQPGAANKTNRKSVGFVYHQKDKKDPRSVPMKETRPSSSSQVFSQILSDKGLIEDENLSEVPGPIINGLESVAALKAKGVPVKPLVRSLAFLQNIRGMQRKPQPANIGKIIGQLYEAGAKEQIQKNKGIIQWYRQLSQPCQDQFFGWLDKVFEDWALKEELVSELPSHDLDLLGTEEYRSPLWLRKKRTPFSWFFRTWDNFCSEDWREALPYQRWADWGACILRTSVSLGFLWEAHFYSELGRWLLEKDGTGGLDATLDGLRPLLYWKPRSDTISTRDQDSYIRGYVYRSLAVRVILDDLLGAEDIKDIDVDMDDLDEIGKWLKGKMGGKVLQELAIAYHDPRNAEGRNAAKNLFETIFYTINCRKEVGHDADFYSLMVTRSRRFKVVEPGREWIVVIASLMGTPKGEALLGNLRQDIEEMGIGVDRGILVKELEKAGLTRSAHDADDALRVSSGF